MHEMESLWKQPKAQFTVNHLKEHHMQKYHTLEEHRRKGEKALWLGTERVIAVEYVINVLKTQHNIFYGLGAQFPSFY